MDSRLVKCSSAKPRLEPFTVKNDLFQSFPHFKQTPQPFGVDANCASTSSTTGPKPYQASTVGPKISITSTTKCEYQKTALDYRIHVHNGFVATSNGLLAKVTAFRLATGKLWETFVGKWLHVCVC